jgi:hypothetical protein
VSLAITQVNDITSDATKIFPIKSYSATIKFPINPFDASHYVLAYFPSPTPVLLEEFQTTLPIYNQSASRLLLRSVQLCIGALHILHFGATGRVLTNSIDAIRGVSSFTFDREIPLMPNSFPIYLEPRAWSIKERNPPIFFLFPLLSK